MLKEVGCGSNTPPSGDGSIIPATRDNTREIDRNQSSDVTASDNGGNSGNGSGLGCGGCGRNIFERWYLRAADRAWHCGCLRCFQCRVPLAAELTCFSRDGNIYCKEDYYRLVPDDDLKNTSTKKKNNNINNHTYMHMDIILYICEHV